MASAQIAGTLRFYRVDANRNQKFIWGADIASSGPSGSSEGTIASTPEKWLFLNPFNSADKVLRQNEILRVTFTANAAATAGTATKSRASIPISYSDGSTDNLGDFANAVFWDIKQLTAKAFVANDETPIAEKTVRTPFALGGGRIFASVENNA
jgi:hypothetical protein